MNEQLECQPDLDIIKEADPEIFRVIALELERQTHTLELIASENTTSPCVMATQGSVLTNKYAEGYPNRRFYAGCEHVDTAERLAIERAKRLFHAQYANVQPHSGTPGQHGGLLCLAEAWRLSHL